MKDFSLSLILVTLYYFQQEFNIFLIHCLSFYFDPFHFITLILFLVSYSMAHFIFKFISSHIKDREEDIPIVVRTIVHLFPNWLIYEHVIKILFITNGILSLEFYKISMIFLNQRLFSHHISYRRVVSSIWI